MSSTSQLAAFSVEDATFLPNSFPLVGSPGVFGGHGQNQRRLFLFDDEVRKNVVQKVCDIIRLANRKCVQVFGGRGSFGQMDSANPGDFLDLLNDGEISVPETNRSSKCTSGLNGSYPAIAVDKTRNPSFIGFRHFCGGRVSGNYFSGTALMEASVMFRAKAQDCFSEIGAICRTAFGLWESIVSPFEMSTASFRTGGLFARGFPLETRSTDFAYSHFSTSPSGVIGSV